jgi:hypothetical protein
MRETDIDDLTFADDPIIDIIAPPNSLNLKPIMMALRWEIINGGITVCGRRNPRYKNNVIIPSLKYSFHITYMDGYILLGTRVSRWCKIPVSFIDDTIPEETINLLVAYIEYKKANGMNSINEYVNAYELSSILVDNDH